jgi:lipid-binding SYLF domain-containing protein
LEGSTVRPDGEANERVYHKKISAEDIVFKHEMKVPQAAHPMISYLDQKARRNESASKKNT